MNQKINKDSHHLKELIIDVSKSRKLHVRKSKRTPVPVTLLKPIHFNGTVKLLFVEDNVFNQELACFILDKIGCSVEIANDGSEAIEILRDKAYDLILMDINMPGLDGYETTRMLREHLVIETPIIAFTTNVLEEDIQRCLDCGMNDHLGKPYTEQQLSSIIYKWTKANQ
jgi:CheY-like chemotaxis protein